MRYSLLILSLAILLSSCNNRVQLNERQQKFNAQFSHELKLPLKVDSVFITHLDTLEAISLEVLNTIKWDSLKKDLSVDLRNSINACIFIESKKQSGRYQDYVDSLNIGMLKNAMAFKIGRVKFTDNSELLLWGINEGSFEADPGYSGISIIASFADNEGGFSHVVVGEEYYAGDPPAMMQRRTSSEINDKIIKISRSFIYEDLDSGNRETENTYLKLETKPGSIKIAQQVTSR